MIRLEGWTPGRLHVVGSLEGHRMRRLFEAISRGTVVLDLSEVDQANDSGVSFLADLPPERCRLAACPSWLSVWLERFRRPAGQRR